MMQKTAVKMQLKPGFAAEYQRRHDAIWPELVTLLKDAGIRDYTIHLDDDTGALFAVMWRDGDTPIADDPVMRRWWDHMADLMEVNADNSPVAVPLRTVFRLD